MVRMLHFGVRAYPPTTMRLRFYFSVLAVLVTMTLLGWGAFVTSIDAGLAVPDWPSSFNSYDLFNPVPGWWETTSVLAEHGHRLLGALVGLMTLILCIWTVATDPRRWMKRLSLLALGLVIFQGVLGGLRVVWVSLDLAVVHACVAQLFFSLLVAMTFFTSPVWLRGNTGVPSTENRLRLQRLAVATALVLYAQIILGALLRHPGTGIDPLLAGLHMGGALLATIFVVSTTTYVFYCLPDRTVARTLARTLLGLLVLQVTLGLVAYFVLLDEAGILRPSIVQIAVNSTHLLVGALLLATTVLLLLESARIEQPAGAPAAASSVLAEPAPVALGR